MREAVARECRATRGAVGLFDASTLGKIEVVGRDAALFLERMYVNAFRKLEVGRCRYGLILTETGFLLDDGVVARLAPDRFHVTTTTGGAARVLSHLEDYLQSEFAGLDVWLTSTSEHWATISVQGPKARETIAPLIEGVDLSTEALPHMSVRDGKICGVTARLMRVSFTGELGYEINVGSAYGLDVWKTVHAEVEKHGGCAYGTEATHVLRAEKGYVIVGQEADGTVTLADLGLDGAIGRAKGDFIGRRSLSLPELARDGRKQLVGLLTEDPAVLLEEGAQATESAAPPAGSAALGHVTSSYRSETVGRAIALALIAGGRSRIGAKLHVSTASGTVPATVAHPCFYDPEGARLRV
jgi:sarcosine oxidase subunit alpha